MNADKINQSKHDIFVRSKTDG